MLLEHVLAVTVNVSLMPPLTPYFDAMYVLSGGFDGALACAVANRDGTVM